VLTMHFARSHWQNTTLEWQSRVRASTRWVWYGQNDGLCRILQNTDTFSSCSSLHTGSGILFHSSQYAHFHVGSSNWLRPFTIHRPWSKGPWFSQLLVKFGE
jgi:hypothetical protein